MLKYKTILITGAAGFIGSNLCHYLTNNYSDISVYGIDALLTGSNEENLGNLYNHGRFSWSFSNINNRSFLFDIFNILKPEVVIHLAAESCVDRSIENSFSFWETNVIGTNNILEACKRFSAKLIINQITDEVYNSGSIKSKEGDKLNPSSPYACSKAAQYYVGRSFINTYNLPIIHTFPSNTFGPRQWPEKIIPKFIINLLNNRAVPLMKSVENRRDWLSVSDHVKALVFLIENGIPGEDYNISGRYELTNLEVTQKLLNIFKKDSSYIKLVEDRKTHDSRYLIDDTKIRHAGWESKDNFDSYLLTTVKWYKENEKTFYNK